MGLSNSTPVYDCVPSALFIQFMKIFNEYDISMFEFLPFFKIYPSKINTNKDFYLKIFIYTVSANLSKNLKKKGLETQDINHYKQFAYNIILCIYQYYYSSRKENENFNYEVDKSISSDGIVYKYPDNEISQEIENLCSTFITYLQDYAESKLKKDAENIQSSEIL